MGCGASQPRQPYDNTRQVHQDHQDSRRLVRLRDVDARHTQRHSTRELQRVDVIKARRRESEAAISNLPKAPPQPEKLPYLKKRMSALMSPERDALKRDLSSLSKSDTSSLASRLAKLGLASHEMRGDGNCQFRGLALMSGLTISRVPRTSSPSAGRAKSVRVNIRYTFASASNTIWL